MLWWEILLNWIPICFSEKNNLFWEAVAWRCSCKESVLKNFANFIGKHLCSPRSATLLKKRFWHRYFPVNFAKFLRMPFFHRTPLVVVSIFPHCYVAKQFLGITYFTDILSFEMFSKNLHPNLKLIFLFSTIFIHFKIGYRQSFITVLRIFFFKFMNLMLKFLYITMFFIHQDQLQKC